MTYALNSQARDVMMKANIIKQLILNYKFYSMAIVSRLGGLLFYAAC